MRTSLIFCASMACVSAPPPPSTSTTTVPAALAEADHTAGPTAPNARGGGPRSVETALTEIAEAKCARLARCGGRDASKSFGSHDECVADARASFAASMPLACGLEIGEEPLAACVAELSECTAMAGEAPHACRPLLLCSSPTD